jgi:hypothetical protein
MECLGLHNKPKDEEHPGHKLTGPKEEGEEEDTQSKRLPSKHIGLIIEKEEKKGRFLDGLIIEKEEKKGRFLEEFHCKRNTL